MASALVSLTNASVVFTVADAGTTVDPETGNITANQTDITYTLYLRKSSSAATSLPGVNTVQAAYEGYCINPTALDLRITEGTKGVLSFGSDAPCECIVEDLRFAYGNKGVLGSTLQSVLGDKIRLVRYWQQ